MEDAKQSCDAKPCCDCRSVFIRTTVKKCPGCKKDICPKCVSLTKNDHQYRGWCNACIWFDIG